jgi:hypothetical protein
MKPRKENYIMTSLGTVVSEASGLQNYEFDEDKIRKKLLLPI